MGPPQGHLYPERHLRFNLINYHEHNERRHYHNTHPLYSADDSPLQ